MTFSNIPTPDRLIVKTPEGEYPILIGAKAIKVLPTLLQLHNLSGKAAVITNTTLAPLYGREIAEALGGALITIPDGESHKTLDTVRMVYDRLFAASLDRKGIVIALGGGVVGDLAGFAAATYLRGVPFVQVPTSLLAMIDSSVGGKVGVDMPQGKNLIGAFKQPHLVVVDPTVLVTLPDSEWRCGVAEMIKHGLVSDSSLLDPSLYKRGSDITDLIKRAVQVKIQVVEADPYEENIRAHLNLGHTFAHAIEKVSNFQWRHGEAVGFGLVAATRLSHKMNACPEELPKQVESLVSALGLPTRCPLDARAVRDAMETDKKRAGGVIRFVLLEGIGKPVLRDDVPDHAVIEVLEGLHG